MRLFFILLIIVINLHSYGVHLSYVQTIKDSDSSITFKLHSSFELGFDAKRTGGRRGNSTTDTIRFYNPDTDSLFSFPVFEWQNIDSIYLEAIFTFNPLDSQFSFFNRADSLLVFFQTFNGISYAPPSQGFESSWQSVYRTSYNFSTRNHINLCKVFPKNLQKFKVNESPLINHSYYSSKFSKLGVLNARLSYWTTIYHCLPFKEIDGD